MWYVRPFFCLSGWAWELVLGGLWGFGPSSTLCVGPSVTKPFGRKGLVAAVHLSKHHSPSLSIVDDFNSL